VVVCLIWLAFTQKWHPLPGFQKRKQHDEEFARNQKEQTPRPSAEALMYNEQDKNPMDRVRQIREEMDNKLPPEFQDVQELEKAKVAVDQKY